MKRKLKKYLEELGIKGRVRNHSKKRLWVIESTTNDPIGPPIAHILEPGMKSPDHIDADGFKRFDGKAIGRHKSWWKITNLSTADIFDSGSDIIALVLYKTAEREDHFGNVVYSRKKNWGDKIHYIVGVERNKKKVIQKYKVSDIGWVNKSDALEMATQGKIDLVVVVNHSSGPQYLRSLPGQKNLGSMS